MFDRQNFMHCINTNMDMSTLACDYYEPLMCVYDIIPVEYARYINCSIDMGIVELKIGLIDNSTANWFRSIISVIPTYNKYGKVLTIIPTVNNCELNLIVQ